MGGSIAQLALFLMAGGALGVIAGLLIGAAISKRQIGQLRSSDRTKLNDVTRQRDKIASKFLKLKSTNKSLRVAVADNRAKLESARKKSKLLAKNVLALRAERENTKVKLSTMQNSLVSVKQHTLSLQREFDKVGQFYKGELVKSFEKRKVIERELADARSEQESFAKLVESSVLEHGSPDEMITAAQLRLGQLNVLERNVNKLEKENAKLRDDAARMKREYEALEREVAKLDELRINNQQLVHCVESLENSRKQHEDDAERYRDQADQSEQLSETLRLKLSDLEKNFADMEQQQHQALEQARKATVLPTLSANDSPPKAVDESQEIVDLAKYSKMR